MLEELFDYNYETTWFTYDGEPLYYAIVDISNDGYPELFLSLKKILAALTHLNTHPWDEGIAEIQISCGVYSLQDNLSKKERMQMNTSMGKHLQFLTQMAVNSPVFKLLFKNYHNHYIQVESLVKQMAKEINEQQQ